MALFFLVSLGELFSTSESGRVKSFNSVRGEVDLEEIISCLGDNISL